MEARTDVAGADELRRHVHGQWAAVAPAWSDHAEYADERGASVTARLLDLSAPRPGERLLELACGPGGLGLAAAKLVAPNGVVVLSDVVAEMTAIAEARADAIGLDNVRTRVLDLEDIDEPDASYDVVLCREGMMFAVDPARAAREMGRIDAQDHFEGRPRLVAVDRRALRRPADPDRPPRSAHRSERRCLPHPWAFSLGDVTS
jgi:SAM-dependent methyltransferase